MIQGIVFELEKKCIYKNKGVVVISCVELSG